MHAKNAVYLNPGQSGPQTIISPHAIPLLSSLQYQGMRNDCGPFTIATVLGALTGAAPDGVQVAEELNRLAWRGLLPVIRRIPNSATFPWGMVDFFRRCGLTARWRFFSSTGYLRAALPGKRVLMPVVGGLLPPWAHVMSLVLYDSLAGWGFANTQRNDQRIHWMDHQTFENQWRAVGRLLIEVVPPN